MAFILDRLVIVGVKSTPHCFNVLRSIHLHFVFLVTTTLALLVYFVCKKYSLYSLEYRKSIDKS